MPMTYEVQHADGQGIGGFIWLGDVHDRAQRQQRDGRSSGGGSGGRRSSGRRREVQQREANRSQGAKNPIKTLLKPY